MYVHTYIHTYLLEELQVNTKSKLFQDNDHIKRMTTPIYKLALRLFPPLTARLTYWSTNQTSASMRELFTTLDVATISRKYQHNDKAVT